MNAKDRIGEQCSTIRTSRGSVPTPKGKSPVERVLNKTGQPIKPSKDKQPKDKQVISIQDRYKIDKSNFKQQQCKTYPKLPLAAYIWWALLSF